MGVNYKVVATALVSAALIVTQLPTTVFAAASNQSVLVPAYSYPKTWTTDLYWDGLIQAGNKAPFIIVNPASGPGTTVKSDYITAMTRAKNAGTKMIGYVRTGYQTKPLNDVFAEIDAWYAMYGSYISGIFFDEITDSPDKICYMATINNYVKRKYNNATTVANPGRHISDAITPYADIFLTVEFESSVYQRNYPEPTSNFEKNAANQNRIYHVVYNVSAADLDNVISLSRQRNAGYIFITDDGNAANTENQYDDLPTYFTSFTNKIASLPATKLPIRGATTAPTGCNDPTANLTPNKPNNNGAGTTPANNTPANNNTASPTAPTARPNATAAASTENQNDQQTPESTTLAETGVPLWTVALIGTSLLGLGLYVLRKHL